MKSWIIAGAALVIVLTGTGFTASTPEYFGQFCWRVSGTPDTVILGFTHMGDGFFTVNGYLDEISMTNKNLVHGCAVYIDNEIRIHFTSSGIYPVDAVGFIGTMVLDPVTLNGYVEGVGMHADTTTGSTGLSYDGTMNVEFMACP